MAIVNNDGIVSGCIMIIINGAALVLNISVMTNLILNRKNLPSYMWLVFNLTVADTLFAFLGLTIRGPGMIFSDYYTSSEAGKVFCILFFYAVYPVISVNFNTYILLVLNQFLALRSPLKYCTQDNSLKRKRRILMTIGGTWGIALLYLGIYLLLVHSGIGTSDYDENMSRCSMTSTKTGKVAHMILQTIFVIMPSFTCLGLYIGIVVILARNKKKNRGGVTNHAFITITILLALFYISHWPSVLLRDIPRLLQTSVKLPTSLNIATSVFYYLNGLTDPIIYGYRSKYLFTRAKAQMGLSFSRRTTIGVSQSTNVKRQVESNCNSSSGYFDGCEVENSRKEIALANLDTGKTIIW